MVKKKNLDLKLKAITNIFDRDAILDLDTSPRKIARYYRLNRIAYWLIVSRQGFVHMGLSDGHILGPEDFAKPAHEVSEYIKSVNAKFVLELAAGKGANLKAIAPNHLGTQFFGLDLPNGQTDPRLLKGLSNVTFNEGDYHDLSSYDSNSMDIVYIIEALCYAQPKEQVIKEVQRVLKPNGIFMVYDGYNTRPYSEMEQEEAILVKMGWKGMLVNPDDMYIKDFEAHLVNNGLKIIREDVLDDAVMPSLKMLEHKASHFFNHPRLARILRRVMPIHFIANTISGYVMPTVVECKLCTYRLTVAKKFR